jgi:glycosyltransferase involved in cell wall biosynthesis
MTERRRMLRNLRPDVFAVMTESLAWQFGKDALMLFGALCGVERLTVLDSRGGSLEYGRTELLLQAPTRIATSYLRGRAAIRDANERLRRLSKMQQPADALSVERPVVAYFRTTPAAGTTPGGATSHINGVVNGLKDLGASVEFIANDRVAGIDNMSATFHLIPPDRDAMPRAAFDVANGLSFADRAADLITRTRPSFIYERYSRFSLAGVDASLKSGIPLFLEYNGSEVWVGKHWDSTARLELLERYEILNLEKATRIFVVSEVERDNLTGRGIPAEKIVVNPNGVDTDVFRPDVGGKDVRGELGIDDEKIVAGFLGTFGPWHGVLALADAIASTPTGSRLHFLLIGDGSLRAEVEDKLRVSGDRDRVTFTGVVNHSRVPALLDACDILVSPHVPLADGSAFFGSPTKLFEYMSMGKAIVASDLAQIGDVLENEKTALLVEPGNSDRLSAALVRLAQDADLRRTLGASSRIAAIEGHTWRQNAQRVLDAYRELE